MNRLIYVLHGDCPRAQQELSFSVLSALKQGVEGVQMELWSDAQNQRPDLPLTPHPLPAAGADLRRLLAEALGEARGPICLIATDTVFLAPPAELFARMASGAPLVLRRDGWLAGRTEWAAALDAAAGTEAEAQIHPGVELLNLGIIGLRDANITCISSTKSPFNLLDFGLNFTQIEQYELSAALHLATPKIATAADLIRRYDDHMRHVYHGRFAAMFPPGAPVNTALADKLPEITEPPKPLRLKLIAKAYALRHGMGRRSESAYLAYLCAFAAPRPEGRTVWANIALDQVETSARPRKDWENDLPRLAPAALDGADLSPETTARWRRYWAER